MRILLHGGNCCGIKHICSLYYPNSTAAARRAIKRSSYGTAASSGHNDMVSHNKYRRYDFFNRAAPKETYKERLKRFVDFIKANRKHGIIEVVLNGYQYSWKPILAELGFKEVSTGTNSNTGSTLIVYHLAH